MEYCSVLNSHFRPSKEVANIHKPCSYYCNQIESSSLLYFSCKLQGEKLQALLDSGAGRTFIDKTKCENAGIAMAELAESFTVSLANGYSLTVTHQVDPKSCRLKFKQFDYRGPVYVLDMKQEHELILGQDFLKSRNPIIDWRARTMTLRKRHHSDGKSALSEDAIASGNVVESTTTVEAVKCWTKPDRISQETERATPINYADKTPLFTMSVNKCADALKKSCKQSYDDACDDHYDAYYKDYDDALLGRRQFLNALKQSKKHLRSKHGYNNDGGLMMIMVRSENGKASIVGVNDAAQDMQEDVRV